MSLLTNEQIAELIGIASNQSTSRDLHDELHEWNDRQTTQQFEVDWSKAPRSAEVAILKSYWIGEGTYALGQTVAEYKRPAPAITPHLHAEIIAKYAEVAARRFDPWVEFEVKSGEEFSWSNCTSFICFRAEYEYRHIGDNK
jgi:hypothetical protein